MSTTQSSSRLTTSHWVAVVSGLAALLCFVLTPFLPVNQTQSSFSWPQNESLRSVNAPLISVSPEKFSADIPLSAMEHLHEGQDLLMGTIPADSPEASDRGLFILGTPDTGLTVVSMSEVLFSLSPEQLADIDPDAVLSVSTTGEGADISISGTEYTEMYDKPEGAEFDHRAQLTGIYTELNPEAYQELVDAGLNAQVEINSRFTSTPTLLKSLAMWLGGILMVLSLAALWFAERGKGVSHPARQRQGFRLSDGVVGGVLVFWHIFGGNTSDDGFITTMARVSDNAGYMANYYRWYGVPESPFGAPYYNLLALLSEISPSSLVMRIPSLVAALLIWWILTRFLLPRLGEQLNSRPVAVWSAAMVFLAFWLPYNNGTRPEPIVALGAVAAWALFEHALATKRFFPAALGTIVASWTLTVGPTGLLAVGAFLVSLPGLITLLRKRMAASSSPRLEASATISAFLGAGTFVMVPVFADQTLAAVMESTSVRSEVGPALPWYFEYVRYSTLFEHAVDGSLTRRFAMFIMILSLVLIIASLLRNSTISAMNRGPVLRLIAIMGLSFFFLMFTPTKWTHHFGIYAGLAAVIAALAAIVLADLVMRSARNRSFVWAGALALLAISFAGWNGWWYISSFGIPWWDKTPQIKGVEFNTIILLLTMIVLAIAVWQAVRGLNKPLEETRVNSLAKAPLAIIAGVIVLSAIASFTKAFIEQYPAYTVGLGNLRTMAGDQCSLANEAMVEVNTNESFLTPLGDISLGESLDDPEGHGFSPNGLPEDISSDVEETSSVEAGGRAMTASTSTIEEESEASGTTSNEEDTTGGQRTEVGINGSHQELPFTMDFTQVPVMGSYIPHSQAASMTSAWFELPEATEDAPLLVVSAAGRISHHDHDGIKQPGETLLVEYGRANASGEVEVLGETEMLDIGPSPTWRNLRLPLADLPQEANAIRLIAEDTSLEERDWLAFTPPRVPTLDSLNNLIDLETPTLLDWSAALQFPCQRSFDHWAGVAEIPHYRISPDHPGKTSLTGFMDYYGGGSMATVTAVNEATDLASYTRNDWHRDWGSLQSLQLRTNSQGVAPAEAEIDEEIITRSGLWHESDMKIRDIEG